MKTSQNHIYLILILAILSSVTPLAVDAYLPSMPNMANHFDVKINKIELTLSIFLIFFAIGQLFGGILSDKIGRKITAISGLIGFTISSFLLFFSTSLDSLYIFRATQAFFGALAAVNSAAIVRDLFHGKEAAKIFSAIASIMMIAPMIAPALGSLIISFYTWNYIFLFLGIYSLLVAFLVYFKLPDTGIKSITKAKEAYKKVLTHKKAMGYILCVSFAFSGMFIFIEKSSFIYMEYFLITKEYFPLFFGANVLMMIVLTKISMTLIKKYQTHKIFKLGILFQLLSGFALVIFSFNPSLILTFIFIVLYIGSLGFIFGNGMALALDFFKKDAGVASSVIGISEFILAGIISFFASLVHTGELTPVFLMMTVTSFLSFLSLKLTR